VPVAPIWVRGALSASRGTRRETPTDGRSTAALSAHRIAFAVHNPAWLFPRAAIDRTTVVARPLET
jgi:hypothetical protein